MATRSKSPDARRIDLATARAIWTRKQGLAEPFTGTSADIVARAGWFRTLGGADVYLAAKARIPNLTKAALDADVAARSLQPIPAVRGCIHLVPRQHVALALRHAESTWRKRAEAEIVKAGATWKEVTSAGRAALETLGTTELSTDALRRALPKGASRSLGEAGKKIGLSSTLPTALRDLEFRGLLERRPETGLDSERYLWRRPPHSVFEDPAFGALPNDKAALSALLLEIFLAQTGPVTLDHFADWAGLGKGEAKAALGEVDATPVAVDGYAENALVLTRELDAVRNAPPVSGVALLTFEDVLVTAHGGPGAFIPSAEAARHVAVWGRSSTLALSQAKHMSQRVFVVDGEIAGFWEYDPDTERIVIGPFSPLPAKAKKLVAARAEGLAHFIATELGHARSFSLDTDAGVRERAKTVRLMAG